MSMSAVVSTANRYFHRHLSPASNFFCRFLQLLQYEYTSIFVALMYPRALEDISAYM